MPRATVFSQSLATDIITPAERPEDARQDAFAWAPNLNIKAGDLVAQETDDKQMAAYAVGGANGTGVAVGVAIYSFRTDANGKVLFFADSATPNYFTGTGGHTAPAWVAGTFDLADLKVAGVAVANLAVVTTAFGAGNVRQMPNGFVRLF